jgi:signal transduction histidine kinase
VLLERDGAQLSDRQRRYLVTVRRNVGRLMRLVGDLSDISKIEDGRLTIHPEPIDLRQVVSEIVGSLAGIVEEKGLQVTISISPEAAVVEGDRHRVMQILRNLLTNACRYTTAGGQITVAADVQAGEGGARLAEVRVSDTGIGIHKEDLEHIFERFYRSEDPLVQEQSGTGLGLAITQSLVELHGSRLWVDSTVGEGSTFGFSLPLVAGIAPFGDVASSLDARDAVEDRAEVGAESSGSRSGLLVDRE